MSASKDLAELRMDPAALYREDVFTDRRIGTIRRLIPVTSSGLDDPTRPVIFEGQTTLLTASGPLPLRFEIDADRLPVALERFGDAAEKALERTLEEIEELRRRAQSPLIVPGRAGLPDLGGPGGGSLLRP